jgi:hypothetical protein
MLAILAGSTTDKLHEGLDFSSGKYTANYILDRKEVTLHPQSGGVFSNAGIRTIRSAMRAMPSSAARRRGWRFLFGTMARAPCSRFARRLRLSSIACAS